MIVDLQQRVAHDIVGQEKIVEAMIIGLLANGNLLVEGLPGLAKTRAIKSLASNIEGSFSRIQFTPDIVSSDIIGRQAYYKTENAGEGEEGGVYKFVKGPIFNNVILADEVNRAPPKSQNAILEAMEERQVTALGESHKVPEMFIVMATMNPAGFEGTFAMPEAQLDRFLMQVLIDYPSEEAEGQIVRLVRYEESQKKRLADKADKGGARTITSQDTIFAARGEIDLIDVPEYIEKYIVDLVFATRQPQKYTYELKSFIHSGVSPRGSLCLDRCSRAHAWLQGQDEVTADNIRAIIKPVLRHRIRRGERAVEHRITADEIVEELLELVPAPDR
jgi:MoxR-like ATPase